MKKGFTLIEVLVAAGVLLIAVLVLVTSYSQSLRQATQTRERQLALIVADNLLERVHAHSYGQSKPSDWGSEKNPRTETFFLVIDGRKVQAAYQTLVEISAEGNGSFFGRSDKPFDKLKYTVLWREPRPDGSWEPKNLTFETVVWRQADVQK